MIIYSKIPQPSTGFFSLMIWPFVKIKVFIDEIYKGILSMIWAELFKHEEKQFSELTHLIAFFIFCIFSLIFYRFENLEDIVVLSFFILWLIDTYLAKQGITSHKYERIVLEIKDSKVIWKSFTPGEGVIQEQFDSAEITQISLTPITLMGGAFRSVQAQVWRIFIIINDMDGYLIYEEKSLSRALKKARDLAHHFQVPLEIANSEGKGEYVAEKLSTLRHRQTDYSHIWKTIQTSTVVKIYKKLSFATAKKMLKSVLEEVGVFLFLIIMAGVMVRFGTLLAFLIGSKIGIEPPTLVLNISFFGTLSFFAPKVDWLSLLAFSFAIIILFYSGWKHSQEHRITIDRKWLRYRIKGQSIVQLPTQKINQFILLKEPKPALLLIDSHGKFIEINSLEDEEEYQELYYRILAQLDKFN